MSERIKVQVGQVWERGRESVTTSAHDDIRKAWVTCKPGEVDVSNGYEHTGDDCCWMPDEWFETATLVASPKADRAGCEEFCGLSGTSDEYNFAPENTLNGTAFCIGNDDKDDRRWCSAQCLDERRPPLEVAPVAPLKTWNCIQYGNPHCVGAACNCKPAPPRAPEPPKCIRAGKPNHKCEGPVLQRVIGHACDGPVAALYCERALLNWEARTNPNGRGPGLAKSSLPERLAAPRLAVDYTWDCLPEAWR